MAMTSTYVIHWGPRSNLEALIQEYALDKKLDLLRLNSMCKCVANMKHYVDVNMPYIYANICNTFTTYVKVHTYLLTYLRRE